jgi:hypothetical protein
MVSKKNKKNYSESDLAAISRLRKLRTNMPLFRSECESDTATPCTAFGCKYNLTTEVALKKPGVALKKLQEDRTHKIRRNCLLDLVANDTSYTEPEIADILNISTAQINRILHQAIIHFRTEIEDLDKKSEL